MKVLQALTRFFLAVSFCFVGDAQSSAPRHSTLIDQWIQHKSTKNYSWYTVNESDRRYFHKCALTFCVTVDFTIGQINVVSTSSDRTEAAAKSRAIMLRQLLSVGEWQGVQLDGSPFKTKHALSKSLQLQTPHIVQLSSGYAGILSLDFALDHYDRRKAKAEKLIHYYAREYQLDPEILIMYSQSVSNLNFHAASAYGHTGLMFVHPDLSGRQANNLISGIYRTPTLLELTSPASNIQLAVSYLSKLHEKYQFVADKKARWATVFSAYLWSEMDVDLQFRPHENLKASKIFYDLVLVPRDVRAVIKQVYRDVVSSELVSDS